MIIIGLLLGLVIGGFIGYKIHNKILMKKLENIDISIGEELGNGKLNFYPIPTTDI